MSNHENESTALDTMPMNLISKSEIDQQIATAHKYPRSIKAFRNEALQMVTLSESVAQECIYALPRDGKVIEGPSARFAEVIASAWGNSRAGARVIGEEGDFIISQGVFHDLEKNVAITFEVPRRIVDKNGRRFKTDMIGVTANAASSIALRNAILKGVPKAFWSDMYDAARAVVMGDFKTLSNRRAEAIKAFQAYGVSEAQILAVLDVRGVEDIGLEKLAILRGILTSIKDGETTPEDAFGERAPETREQKQAAAEQQMGVRSKSAQKETVATAQPAQQQQEQAQSTSAAPEKDPRQQSLIDEPSADNPVVSAEALKFLRMKIDVAGISESSVEAHFDIDLNKLTEQNYQKVLGWVKEQDV